MIYIKGTYFAEIRSNTQFLNNGATKYALRRRVELNWTITFHSGGSLGSLHVSIFALNMALSSETLVQHQKMLGARAPQVPDCRAL
ncbi:hypothetical protein ACSQ67_025869 [Phaseolus vulgaris]